MLVRGIWKSGDMPYMHGTMACVICDGMRDMCEVLTWLTHGLGVVVDHHRLASEMAERTDAADTAPVKPFVGTAG